MKRFDALQLLAGLAGDALAVTNLANTATEWHAARPSEANLYAVGMGMVTPYALGIALARPERRVLALDGDGGILFDPTVFGLMAQTRAPNLCVVVFDNGGYISTGTLPTVASMSSVGVDIAHVGLAFGLDHAVTVQDLDGLRVAYLQAVGCGAPSVIVAKVSGEQAFVGPLPMDLKENKYRFVRHIEQSSGLRLLKPSAKEHGAPAGADPVARAASGFGGALHAAFAANGIDFVAGLPCSGFTAAQALLMEDPAIRYVPVAHEGTAMGLCAGAWLGGKRPAALVENFGLFASAYHLLRGHLSYGIPTLVVTEYRGDTGDQEFFAESGEVTPDFLKAMRVNFRAVHALDDLAPQVRDAQRWMAACLRPFALLPSFELTRLKR